MSEQAALQQCQEILEYEFKDPELLLQALTHASSARTRLDSNERMEFLGDAVLGFVTCTMLYKNYEKLSEGDMTKIKSTVVSRVTCTEIIKELKLGQFVIMGNEIKNPKDIPDSIAACLMESIIGAIYLDAGLRKAQAFIKKHFQPYIDEAMSNRHQKNFKSLLQQYMQREFGSPPEYVTLDEQGPEHSKCFEIGVMLDGNHYSSAWGKSKKIAEQAAAKTALISLGVLKKEHTK